LDKKELSLVTISRGLNFYTRRLMLQVALGEDFIELLSTPKSLHEIAELREYKNINVLQLFLESLVTSRVVKFSNGYYEWSGGDIKISKEERTLETHGESWFLLLQLYAKTFPKILRGKDPLGTLERGIWDSVYSSSLYEYIWGEGIKKFLHCGTDRLIDFGVSLGWSSIKILDLLNPKELIVVTYSEQERQIVEENLLHKTSKNDNKTEITVVNLDLFGKKFNEQEFGKIDGALVSYMIHRHSADEVLLFLNNIRNLIGINVPLLFLQPVIYHKDQPRHFEVLLYSEQKFHGYPLFEDLANMLIEAGFKTPKRYYNLFIASRTGDDEGKISIPSPPKYCYKCGRMMPRDAYFCPFCGAVLEYNFSFTLF